MNKLTIIYYLIIIIVLIIFSNCTIPLDTENNSSSSGSYIRIASNYGSHCYRGSGASYYKNNKTFFTWPGPGMNSYVGYFDHLTNKAGTNVLVNTFNDYTTWAYHDYPRLVVGADNKIHLFVCDHTTKLYYYRSSNADDISGTWHNHSWTERAGYPFPVVSSGGQLFIFYIIHVNTPLERPLYYRTSTDNGLTWSSSPVKCIDRDIDNWKEMYVGSVKFASAAGGYPDRILIVWTLSGVSGDGTTTAHDKYHKDVYFSYLNINDLHMYSADKTDLGTTISGSTEWNKCLVLDTGPSLEEKKIINYTHNVTANSSNGYPIVLYEKYNYSTLKYEVFSKLSNGTNWSDESLVISGSSISDVYFENDKFIALCKSSSNIYSYSLNESNMTWDLIKTYSPPVVPQGMMKVENYNNNRKAKFMIFESYGSTYDYTGNNKIYVLGDG
ncbi:MAG: BNR-4 repeat-containing protein, partial [Spirochaetes bacterium]|nr:BNR-4 repeat-containing protein [Spirochaetota bacterium]